MSLEDYFFLYDFPPGLYVKSEYTDVCSVLFIINEVYAVCHNIVKGNALWLKLTSWSV